MTITNKVSLKSVNAGNTPIPDVPDATTIGAVTDAGDGTTATVAYTAAATGGAVTTFTATSDPGSFTGTGSSPISVTGLTAGTAYTFKVKGTNTTATGPESSASGSLTLAVPPSYYSIATSNGGNAASFTFSSIPQTYKHLQIRGIGRTSRASLGDVIYLRCNGDTGSNYRAHVLWTNGTSLSSYDQGASTYMAFDTPLAGSSANTNVFGSFIIDIFDYTSTNKNKVVRILSGYDNNSTTSLGQISMCSGLWLNTAAITSLTLPVSFGSLDSNSSFALYGIKG